MSNIRIVGFTYTQGGSLAERVRFELNKMGFSHLYNRTDYEHFARLHRNARRRQKLSANPSWDAVNIAHAMIDSRPEANCDFEDLESNYNA